MANKTKYKTLQEKISKEAGFKFWGYSTNQHFKFDKARLNDMVNYLNKTYGNFTEEVHEPGVASMVWVIKPKDIDFEEELMTNSIYIQKKNGQRQFYLTWMVKERLVDKIFERFKYRSDNYSESFSDLEYLKSNLVMLSPFQKEYVQKEWNTRLREQGKKAENGANIGTTFTYGIGGL
jgi:hypothetical protein